MLYTKSKVIGNHTYHVTSIGAGEGCRILVKLVKLAGPTLSQFLFDSLRAKSLLDTETLGAFSTFCDRLSVEDLNDFRITLGKQSQVGYPDGRTVPLSLETQELHFSANYLEMLRWLLFALEVNFAGPLGSWNDVLNLAKTLAVSPSKSPKESTGGSGE